jgi:HK97 gp10 family phage protein
MARSIIGGSANSLSRDARKAFKVEGLDEILANMSKVLNKTSGAEAKEVYLAAALKLRDKARQNVNVVTGNLRRGIFAARGDENKSNALVGVNYRIAPHAHLVEYGTVRMAARPYLRPALTMTGPEIARMIREGLLKIIESHQK